MLKAWLLSILLLTSCVYAEESLNYNEQFNYEFVEYLNKNWEKPQLRTFEYSTDFLEWDKYDIEFEENETDATVVSMKAGLVYRPTNDMFMILGAQFPLFLIGDVADISDYDRFIFGDFNGYDGYSHGRFGFTISIKF